MFSVPVVDQSVAMRLAWILKTLLGLEAIIKMILFIYVTVAEDGKLPINPLKAKLDKPTQ